MHDQRTIQQNKSLHLWLTLLADALNDSGQCLGDGRLVRLPIRFTPENLKETVLRPYMESLWGITSTTKLDTTQIKELYKDLDLICAERTGVHIEWPSEHSLAESQREQYAKK